MARGRLRLRLGILHMVAALVRMSRYCSHYCTLENECSGTDLTLTLVSILTLFLHPHPYPYSYSQVC